MESARAETVRLHGVKQQETHENCRVTVEKEHQSINDARKRIAFGIVDSMEDTWNRHRNEKTKHIERKTMKLSQIRETMKENLEMSPCMAGGLARGLTLDRMKQKERTGRKVKCIGGDATEAQKNDLLSKERAIHTELNS
jgi:hypothetical protein